MKSKSIIFFILAIFIGTNVIAQQVKLSSDTTTKSFDFSDYSKLDVASDFKVNVTLSSKKEAITVTTNSNLMDYVTVYKEGNTLFLRLKKNTWFKGRMVLDVAISTAMITDFTASSDAIITLNTALTTDTVRIDCKGDAVFKGIVTAKTLFINGKSDAKITLSGAANTMTMNLKSDSEFINKDFTVQNLTVSLAGDSKATLTVTNMLDATASGDSELRYAGNPSKVKQSSRGDSDIRAIK
ncbi:head GIN domain-containing protein [uncultured Dokdonia sp.]|uniref:head GIN domain-containing protein n=1 Tax=uncultured Dokdonia sp. TaxID=575653 RepID=UPI0026020A66|nr:head GIN domain-containing protein [uncultured Dokdonia sp.]